MHYIPETSTIDWYEAVTGHRNGHEGIPFLVRPFPGGTSTEVNDKSSIIKIYPVYIKNKGGDGLFDFYATHVRELSRNDETEAILLLAMGSIAVRIADEVATTFGGKHHQHWRMLYKHDKILRRGHWISRARILLRKRRGPYWMGR